MSPNPLPILWSLRLCPGLSLLVTTQLDVEHMTDFLGYVSLSSETLRDMPTITGKFVTSLASRDMR